MTIFFVFWTWFGYFGFRIVHNFFYLKQPIHTSFVRSVAHPFLLLIIGQIVFNVGINEPTIPQLIGGSLTMMSGLIFIIGAHKALGKNYNTAIVNKTPPSLTTTSYYKIIRHPIYTGAIIMAIGSEILLDSLFVFLVYLSIPFIIWQINKEERELKEKFGLRWDALVHQTPYKLFPGLY